MFSETRRLVLAALFTATFALLLPAAGVRAQCRAGRQQSRTPQGGLPTGLLSQPQGNTLLTARRQTALRTALRRQQQLSDLLTAMQEQQQDPLLTAARQRRLQNALLTASRKQRRQDALLTALQRQQQLTGSLTAAQEKQLIALLAQQSALQQRYAATEQLLAIAALPETEP